MTDQTLESLAVRVTALEADVAPVICRETQRQNCHNCADMSCGDNMRRSRPLDPRPTTSGSDGEPDAPGGDVYAPDPCALCIDALHEELWTSTNRLKGDPRTVVDAALAEIRKLRAEVERLKAAALTGEERRDVTTVLLARVDALVHLDDQAYRAKLQALADRVAGGSPAPSWRLPSGHFGHVAVHRYDQDDGAIDYQIQEAPEGSVTQPAAGRERVGTPPSPAPPPRSRNLPPSQR